MTHAPEKQRDAVSRRLTTWGSSTAVIAPLTTWRILVVPGWL
ncbi:hypothetical protein [Streptomyces ziwulingensis]